MKCLETRTRDDGFRYRRYRNDDGAILATVEVPADLWRQLNRQGRGKDRAAAVQRKQQRLAVRAEAVRRFNDGWKVSAIAHDLNISERTVRRWGKQ